MPRRLADAVVVITGASSGIGRAAALMFAERGATLVLAARREEALREVAAQCEQRGGRALAVPTDVTSEAQVGALARQAIESFGRIDVWVNNAAVNLFGRIEETPIEATRQVLETNLFGYLYGTRAVLPYFREQGSGVLIYNDSVAGTVPLPYGSAYVISKHGVRALADCLRMELALDELPEIHVCTVMPASIDTPLFQQAANYTGRAVEPIAPIYPAERVAEAIVELAENPRREVVVGEAGRVAAAGSTLAPGTYERRAARRIEREQFQERRMRPTPGNLFQPMPEYAQVSGGWEGENGGTGGRAVLAGLAVALPLMLWAWRAERLPRPWR